MKVGGKMGSCLVFVGTIAFLVMLNERRHLITISYLQKHEKDVGTYMDGSHELL